MITEVIEKVIGPLFGSLSAYLNLPAYMKIKYAEKTHGKHTYFREEDYWRDAIGQGFHRPAQQNLKHGDVIELQAFDLSEWFPRAPGSFWTQHGSDLRHKARREMESQTSTIWIFTPKGKEFMIHGGIGTLRLASQPTLDGATPAQGSPSRECRLHCL